MQKVIVLKIYLNEAAKKNSEINSKNESKIDAQNVTEKEMNSDNFNCNYLSLHSS